jgi:uncharacterized protein (DUF1501 family)
VPLVMRGKAEVLSWIPQVYNSPLRDSTVARLMDLYAQTDPGLSKAFSQGMELDKAAMTSTASGKAEQMGKPMRDFVDAAEAAASFMSKPDGPRIGALSFNGWDTHANEGVLQGQLGNRLQGLDQALKAFHDGMGATWKDTAVVIITEFGRTAAVNGTDGTDHGMATTAMLVGGGINGGRILADWPGLADAALYERRDLKPTADLRGLLKGVLQDHLGIPTGALGSMVFPDSTAVKPISGLIA